MRKWMRQNLWRHLIGITISLFALFPLYLVVISSFSSTGSLQLSSFIPTEISFKNYEKLFNDPTIPYLKWVKNSLVIAGSVAVLSVAIGSSSAFQRKKNRNSDFTFSTNVSSYSCDFSCLCNYGAGL